MFEDVIKKPVDYKVKIDRNKEQSNDVVNHQEFLNQLKKDLGNSEESRPNEDNRERKYEKMRIKDSGTRSGIQTAVPPNQTQKILAMLKEKKNLRSSSTIDDIK